MFKEVNMSMQVLLRQVATVQATWEDHRLQQLNRERHLKAEETPWRAEPHWFINLQ